VEVVPWLVTYNSMMTGPCMYRCVEHLLGVPPRGFGSAIKDVELQPHCHTRHVVLPNLDGTWDRFQAGLGRLPFVRFYRTRQRFVVHYASALIHREELFGVDKKELPPHEFTLLCWEFAAALLMVRRRLKPTDDFDLVGLEMHLQQRLALLPFPRPVIPETSRDTLSAVGKYG
jgi:hypothetical protein